MKVIILCPSLNQLIIQRLNYVLEFLTTHPLNASHVRFELNSKSLPVTPNRILEYGSHRQFADSFFVPAYLQAFAPQAKVNSLCCNHYIYEHQALYSVEEANRTPDAFFQDKVFGFDIFSTLFFHISRIEEYHLERTDRDPFNRTRASAQFLVQHKIEKIPVVDHLVFYFLKALGLQPEKKSTSMIISHDIDELTKFSSLFNTIKKTGGLLLRERHRAPIHKLWYSYLKYAIGSEKDPYDVFDWLLTDSSKPIKKVIYYLVGGNTRYDSPYPLKQKFQETVRMALERSYVIGIHPSFDTYDDFDMMKKEKDQLAEATKLEITNSRQHFLRFSFPITPDNLEKLGIIEDSSLGYNDRIGFRCGTGFPYKLYNFREERPYAFLESPMVFMDYSLFLEGQHSKQHITRLWSDFITQNNQLTCINFNFHNSRFDYAWMKGLPLKSLYADLLK